MTHISIEVDELLNDHAQISVVQFSDYLVCLFASYGSPLTNKRLQLLLYYVQAWHLVYFDGQNILKELPQAWRNCPVYTDVHDKYKDIVFDPISPSEQDISLFDSTKQLDNMGFSDKQKKYIESVLNHYGSKITLIIETSLHNEAPYIEARKGLGRGETGTNFYSLKTMHEYYSKLLADTDN